MTFQPRPTRQKVQVCYKTIYIKDELTYKLNQLATKYNTSFNNIVISILEDFFETQEKNS